MSDRKKRDIDTDLMRIVLAYLVVLAHSTDKTTCVGQVINCICRFNLPAFAMISGYYLLDGSRPGKSFLRKGILTIFVALLWSGIYYAYYALSGDSPAVSFPVYLFTEPSHLWYLWMCASLYLITPVLTVFCCNASKKVYGYALLGMALLGSPCLILIRSGVFQPFTALMSRTKLPTEFGFIFVYLAGDYLRRYPPKLPKIVWPLLFLIGSAAAGVGMAVFFRRGWSTDLMLSCYMPSALCASIGFFQSFRVYLAGRTVSEKLSAVIRTVAGCTMGSYLLHPMLIWNLRPILPYGHILPLLALTVYLAAVCITFLLHRIPPLRKVL